MHINRLKAMLKATLQPGNRLQSPQILADETIDRWK